MLKAVGCYLDFASSSGKALTKVWAHCPAEGRGPAVMALHDSLVAILILTVLKSLNLWREADLETL